MNHDADTELWRLLGKAKEPHVSPFFARNVLREIRGLQQARPGLFGWLRDHCRTPALAGTMALLLIGSSFFVAQQWEQRKAVEGQLLAMAQTVSASPDYHVIGHLDELLDSEENSIWLSDPN